MYSYLIRKIGYCWLKVLLKKIDGGISSLKRVVGLDEIFTGLTLK
jgi:hypothetical protein